MRSAGNRSPLQLWVSGLTREVGDQDAVEGVSRDLLVSQFYNYCMYPFVVIRFVNCPTVSNICNEKYYIVYYIAVYSEVICSQAACVHAWQSK